MDLSQVHGLNFPDLMNPCMYEYYKDQQANANDNNNGDGNNDGLTDEYAESLNNASKARFQNLQKMN